MNTQGITLILSKQHKYNVLKYARTYEEIVLKIKPNLEGFW